MCSKEMIDIATERVATIGVDAMERTIGVAAEPFDGDENVLLLGDALLFTAIVEPEGYDRDGELTSFDEPLDRGRANRVRIDGHVVTDAGECLSENSRSERTVVLADRHMIGHGRTGHDPDTRGRDVQKLGGGLNERTVAAISRFVIQHGLETDRKAFAAHLDADELVDIVTGDSEHTQPFLSFAQASQLSRLQVAVGRRDDLLQASGYQVQRRVLE